MPSVERSQIVEIVEFGRKLHFNGLLDFSKDFALIPMLGILLLGFGQSSLPVGLPGDPTENYREAVSCYGVFASTATLQRAINNEPGALQADEQARAFMGLASLSARDAGVPREDFVQSLRQSPSAAMEPLRGSDDEVAITAFVERLNARADECVAFVNGRSNGAS